MSSAKKMKPRNLSVRDMVIEAYIDNREEIKRLTAVNKKIQEEWQHCGSFATRNFFVEVGKTKQVRAYGVKDGVEKFGKGFMKYCRETTRWYYDVKRKGE